MIKRILNTLKGNTVATAIVALSLFLIATPVFALTFWYLDGTTLKPVDSTWDLEIDDLTVNGSCTGCSGAAANAAFDLTTNTFSQSALAPTTTQNLLIDGVGTSTFAGGLEVWRQIGSPYFHATSSSATSTFAGGVSVESQSLKIPVTSCTEALETDSDGNIVCGSDATGASWGQTFEVNANGDLAPTSTIDILAPAQFFASSTSLFDGLLTFTNATGTQLSLTDLFISGDQINDFAGTGLTVTGNALTADLGTSVDLASEITGTLPVANGGTGATSLNNLITLATHTAGDFVGTITGGTGIDSTGATTGEDVDHTLSLDLSELGTETTLASGDFIAVEDITDNGSQKITLSNFALAIDSILNLANIGGTLDISGQTNLGSGNGATINGDNVDFDCSDVTDSGADDGVTCSTEDIVVTLGNTVGAGEIEAAAIDGDDVNSNIAGRSLTLTSASPDTLDIDSEIFTYGIAADLFATSSANGIATTTEDFISIRVPVASTITDFECYADPSSKTGTSTIRATVASNPLAAGTDILYSTGVNCGFQELVATSTFSQTAVSAGDYIRIYVDDAEPTGSRPGIVYTNFELTKDD